MTAISGKTQSGLDYEGDYEMASGGRVLWNATFRSEGNYAGVRHGRLFDMQDVVAGAVDELVKNSIESTWGNAT